MTAELRPCPAKGCPWRGKDPHACPLHAAEVSSAWDRQHLLRNGSSYRHSSHRT